MDTEILKFLERCGAVGAVFAMFHYRISRMEKTLDNLPCHGGQPPAPPREKSKIARRCLTALALLIIAVCSGCARFAVDMKEVSKDGIERETKSRVVVWGDAKQTMDKMRVSHGKTQSLGAAGLDQETTSTNALAAFSEIRRILEILAKP